VIAELPMDGDEAPRSVSSPTESRRRVQRAGFHLHHSIEAAHAPAMEVSMNIALIALWGAVGWCGTPYPGWWRGPRDGPQPEPWLVVKILGVMAGILGGWAFTVVFGPSPEPWTAALPAAASAIGAFVGSRVAVDVYGRVRGG
jgi:hypothetical protein